MEEEEDGNTLVVRGVTQLDEVDFFPVLLLFYLKSLSSMRLESVLFTCLFFCPSLYFFLIQQTVTFNNSLFTLWLVFFCIFCSEKFTDLDTVKLSFLIFSCSEEVHRKFDSSKTHIYIGFYFICLSFSETLINKKSFRRLTPVQCRHSRKLR